MKFALTVPYAGQTPRESELMVHAADRLDYHSVWVPEVWAHDAFMMLASLAGITDRLQLATGIVNVYSRTPALIAQSTATLDALSGGRAILGIGASGPQVVKGWHGVEYAQPLQRTREVVAIVRQILRREPLHHHGEVFDLRGGLKLINHPVRPKVPIVLAALGPKNVALAAEIADGWMPTLFSPRHATAAFGSALEAGNQARESQLGTLEIIVPAVVAVTDDAGPVRDATRASIALYVGGMGSRSHNFYNRLFCEYGYEREAAEIQELYLSGDKHAAEALVSDEMVDEVSIIGSPSQVRERVAEFAQAGATTILASLLDPDPRTVLPTLEALASSG